MRFGNEMFLGLLLIILGVILILRYYFNLNIPIIRTIIAFALIYLGVVILFSGFGPRGDNIILFNTGTLNYSHLQDEYNLIFSNGVIDLSNASFDDEVRDIEVNVIFSSGKLIIPQDVTVNLRTNAAFARSELPNRDTISFGNQRYKHIPEEESKTVLNIETSVVFGNLDIIEQ